MENITCDDNFQYIPVGMIIIYTRWYILVLGRTQFVGSEFGNFGGFKWVRSSILVGEPGFERVRSSD